jgi:hypothetical protein
MVRWEELGPPPLIVNDNDITASTMRNASSPQFNDLSFFALMFQAMVTHKKMLSLPDVAGDVFTEKLQTVLAFERSIEKDYYHIGHDATPLEKFAQQAAKTIIAGMHLSIRRPPYKHRAGSVPPSDNFDILEQATYALQQDLKKKSSEYAPWAWKSWVQWHALAIILAELCSRKPSEDHELSYSVAAEGFRQYSSLIADSEKGMLWKPIAKLMRRLQQLRANRITAEPLPTTSLSSNDLLNIPGKASSSSGESYSADPSTLATSDLYQLDDSEHWFTDFDSTSIPQGEVGKGLYDDAEFNWATFMDYVNMDATADFQNE